MANDLRAREALLPKIPLLATECRREFNRIRAALEQLVKPADVVQQIYLDEMVHRVWEIMRCRRCKVGIVNGRIRAELRAYIAGHWELKSSEEAERLANRWYEGPQGKKEVHECLAEFQPDESAIEAEAIRESLAELEVLEKLIVMAEAGRDRAFRIIANYRYEFAEKLRAASNRIIEGDAIAIEDKTKNDQRSAA
jgi:hypothetical protein